ncbi:nitrous oxide reductase family maturation protein NosD [Shewanella oncorhynchi]|uniref:nitrous oxide reductase family maturation protein NosD n=1 Tax=Shewanella TaxID=22 RepID=UPI0021DABCAC|nr:nitrous oxide reductase family maturation protein NosD [Shewanella sp. SM69]MCU8039607.1 nitrous oxide reductase family maturation protein NosD [Shewanella sp. SM69]
MKLRLVLIWLLCFASFGTWAALLRVTDTDSLTLALNKAQAGDTLVLATGVYEGSFKVTQSISLKGEIGATLDALRQGSALVIEAPQVSIEGLNIRHWGRDLYYRDAAILLKKGADHVQIKGNRLVGDGFGIYGEQLNSPTITDNSISGNGAIHVLDRGDGIYLKHVNSPQIDRNQLIFVRDGVYLESVTHSRIYENQFTKLQYGIHYMYTQADEAWQNQAIAVDGGYALMNSTNIYLHHNRVTQARDFGILLNITEASHVQANVASQIHNPKGTVELGNEGKGIFIYAAQHNRIQDNEFSHSDTGISMAMGGEENRLWHNRIMANQTQVKYVGESQLEWSYQGQGNYWSEYQGWDLNGDGFGDIVHRPNDSLDKLFWLYPEAKLLMESPVVLLLRWVERQFKPQVTSGISDSFPLMQSGAHVLIDGGSR